MAVRNLDNVKNFVAEKGREKLVSTVSEAYELLHYLSPVWSGSYIHSHRLTLDKLDESWTNLKPMELYGVESNRFEVEAADREQLRAAAMMLIPQRLAVLRNLGDAKKIYISNSTPWAYAVEEWWCHYVYRNTANWLRTS